MPTGAWTLTVYFTPAASSLATSALYVAPSSHSCATTTGLSAWPFAVERALTVVLALTALPALASCAEVVTLELELELVLEPVWQSGSELPVQEALELV